MRGESGDIWNMQVLSFLSRVLTSLITMGTVGVEEAKDAIMGGMQCLNLFF